MAQYTCNYTAGTIEVLRKENGQTKYVDTLAYIGTMGRMVRVSNSKTYSSLNAAVNSIRREQGDKEERDA